uniref:Myosin XVIIIB n=1 Tax=Strix occidentalis caurina TaxID=311401 RepID=A0A8D0EZA2_STROC
MAISSRLALWEQKESLAAPPLLLSVIPGGFIKQLVRETEKEAKAAKLRKETKASAKEEVSSAGSPTALGPCPHLSPAQSSSSGMGGPSQGSLLRPSAVPGAVLGGGVLQQAGGPGTGVGSFAPSWLDPAPLFAWQPTGEDGEAPAGDTPTAGGEVPSERQPLPNGLHTEGQGGQGSTAPPDKVLPPGRAAPGAIPSKAPSPTPSPAAAAPKAAETPRPEAPKAAKPSCPEKSPKDPWPGGGPLAPTAAPRKGPQHCSKVPSKEGDVPKGTGPQSTKKEKGAPPSHEQPLAKARAKREPGPAGKGPEKMKKDVGGGKKEPREIKKPGKTANKSEGLEGELRGIQEKSEDVVKEVGKAKEELGERKEAPGESKETGGSTDKDQVTCPQTCRALGAGGRCPRGQPGGQRRPRGAGWGVAVCGASAVCPARFFRQFLLDSPLSSPQAPRDVWYEAEKVWLVQRDGFTLATQLKPDVGTPELPSGRVRVRREADGSVTEVDEDSVQRTNPPSLDYADDLSALISLNECSALHTLQQRYQARLPCTYAGPGLVWRRAPGAAVPAGGTAFKGKRDSTSPHVCSVAQRAYRTLLLRRQDQAIVALGRSGAGRTTCCRSALEYLVGTAGSVDGSVSVEKIQAMFTVLGAFGSVTTSHSSSSTRFSMVLSLDFSATGRITAAHLQTMLLERNRVTQQPHGESSFNVFPLMLAGLDAAHRTMLHLHQVAESNSFGIKPFSKVGRNAGDGATVLGTWRKGANIGV